MKDKSTEHPFCLWKKTVSLSDIDDKTVGTISQNDKKPESHPTSSFKLSFVLYTEKSHRMRNDHRGTTILLWRRIIAHAPFLKLFLLHSLRFSVFELLLWHWRGGKLQRPNSAKSDTEILQQKWASLTADKHIIWM